MLLVVSKTPGRLLFYDQIGRGLRAVPMISKPVVVGVG